VIEQSQPNDRAARPSHADWPGYMRAYRAMHPEYVEREHERRRSHPRQHAKRYDAHLTRDWRYNLAPGWYDATLAAQGGTCADCHGPETKTRLGRLLAFAVDHDRRCCPGFRSCGRCVRGIVCHACNNRRTIVDRAYKAHPVPVPHG
jgi:hypothetical protein